MTTLSENEIIRAMDHSLEQWGIKKHQFQEHAEFYDRAMETALLVKREKTYEPLDGEILSKIPKLPGRLTEAFRHIVRQEIQTKRTFLVCDMLSDELPNIFGPPYVLDKYKNRYMRRDVFEPFKLSQLNPLRRFIEYKVPSSLYSFNMITMESTMKGIIFETILSHHVVHSNIQCNHCKKRGTIQWFGGSSEDSSWRDMVCTSCQSTYEIKSKATPGHIQKCFKYNSIPGGSYRLFHKMRSQSNSKHYIVLISRQYEWPKVGPAFYQTEIAEIHEVLPTLADRSFVNLDKAFSKDISLTSLVKTKHHTWKKWLQVPAKKVDWNSIARSVYEDVFPDEAWDTAKKRLEEFVEKTKPIRSIWNPDDKKWFYEDCYREPNIAEAMQNLKIEQDVDEGKHTKEKEDDAAINKDVKLMAELEAMTSITENWDDE